MQGTPASAPDQSQPLRTFGFRNTWQLKSKSNARSNQMTLAPALIKRSLALSPLDALKFTWPSTLSLKLRALTEFYHHGVCNEHLTTEVK